MKKLFLLFLMIFFASFVSAGNICCERGCFPDTKDGYELKCCTNADDPNKGTAYLGCKGGDGKSYCLKDLIGTCLECQYIGSTYQWVDISSTKCGACKHCDYNSITAPTTSSCVFDDNYKCIGGTSTCLTEGQESGTYCCKSNGVADAGKPACAPRPIGNTCYYGSTPRCSASNGWNCTTYSEDSAVDYTNCYTTSQIVDNKCYYTDRTVICTQTGWQCTSGGYCGIPCSGKQDSDSDGTPDVCDTENTPEDCIDLKDNNGNNKCDTNGGNCCQDTNKNGQCESSEYTNMVAESNCAAEICSACTWPTCRKVTCENAYKTSTGLGSCHYKGGLTKPCCDDSDNDNICDSNDNCPRASNAGQADADNDTIGDLCDLCPNIKQDESLLSADKKKLCTSTGEEPCSSSNKCNVVNVGEDFFCDGNIWINKNLCGDCFSPDNVHSYYWIDNYNAVCNITAGKAIYTDKSEAVCEFLESGTQNGCNEGEEGCWDNNANLDTYTQCCGDDSTSDTWVDSQKKACYEGKFYTEPDDLEMLCELVKTGTQNGCNVHNEEGCWYNGKCCGDDSGETWTYSTNNIIDDILVNAGCYKGKWYARTGISVTYYEIFN